MQERAVNISSATILKVVVVLLALTFLYAIREVLAVLFISLVFASAVDPWVDKLQRFRIPRAVTIVMLFVVAIAIIVTSIALLVPPMTNEITEIASKFKPTYEKVLTSIAAFQVTSTAAGFGESVEKSLNSFADALTGLTSGIFTGIAGVFGGIFSVIGFFMLTFYLTVEERGMKKFVGSIAPVKYQPYLVQKIHQIQFKMGAWFRGQLILSLVVGLVTYIGLLILGVDYALVLALVAGVFEFVPYVGPIVSAIPAVFLAYSQSSGKALAVLILYLIIQQLENQVLVPKIMQRAVGLNPVVVIIVMLIGAKLGGLLGILLAVPTATILSIFLEDFFKERRERDVALEVEEGENGEA